MSFPCADAVISNADIIMSANVFFIRFYMFSDTFFASVEAYSHKQGNTKTPAKTIIKVFFIMYFLSSYILLILPFGDSKIRDTNYFFQIFH